MGHQRAPYTSLTGLTPPFCLFLLCFTLTLMPNFLISQKIIVEGSERMKEWMCVVWPADNHYTGLKFDSPWPHFLSRSHLYHLFSGSSHLDQLLYQLHSQTKDHRSLIYHLIPAIWGRQQWVRKRISRGGGMATTNHFLRSGGLPEGDSDEVQTHEYAASPSLTRHTLLDPCARNASYS